MTSKSQAGLKRGSNGVKIAITKAKYEKIENGMDLAEVEKIIGSKGEETNSVHTGKFESSSYRWKGDKYSCLTVRFRDSKVIFKAQDGLK
jgi:hypothetical protein